MITRANGLTPCLDHVSGARAGRDPARRFRRRLRNLARGGGNVPAPVPGRVAILARPVSAEPCKKLIRPSQRVVHVTRGRTYFFRAERKFSERAKSCLKSHPASGQGRCGGCNEHNKNDPCRSASCRNGGTFHAGDGRQRGADPAARKSGDGNGQPGAGPLPVLPPSSPALLVAARASSLRLVVTPASRLETRLRPQPGFSFAHDKTAKWPSSSARRQRPDQRHTHRLACGSTGMAAKGTRWRGTITRWLATSGAPFVTGFVCFSAQSGTW